MKLFMHQRCRNYDLLNHAVVGTAFYDMLCVCNVYRSVFQVSAPWVQLPTIITICWHFFEVRGIHTF